MQAIREARRSAPPEAKTVRPVEAKCCTVDPVEVVVDKDVEERLECAPCLQDTSLLVGALNALLLTLPLGFLALRGPILSEYF